MPASPDSSAAGSLHPDCLSHVTSTVRLSECCSLDADFGGASSSKRRRVRHQHFWRNSDKLPPDHRLYVASADIKLALEEVRPLRAELSFFSFATRAQASFPSSVVPSEFPSCWCADQRQACRLLDLQLALHDPRGCGPIREGF
jgi:hypothetical protein